ncbi:hypothetical protein [Chelativorans sp. YIM 93263]|nr:hypothetical protein [Chelativorans sp. YIM 93263]
MEIALFWLIDGTWAATEPRLPRGRSGYPQVDRLRDQRPVSC